LDNWNTVNSILWSNPTERLCGGLSEVEYKAGSIYKPAVCFQTVSLKRLISPPLLRSEINGLAQ
jgi:hypothetical protein